MLYTKDLQGINIGGPRSLDMLAPPGRTAAVGIEAGMVSGCGTKEGARYGAMWAWRGSSAGMV